MALDSPGVLKFDKKNSSSRYDDSASHNFTGLVTLFTFLMYGHVYKYQLFGNFDVPFDVVSMSQCRLEDELYLVVGVSENEKTHKQKSKRTKLGSYFFHTVSQFLNNNSLQKMLSMIVPKMQHFYLKTSSNKLSSFANIMPDSQALWKLLDTKESLLVDRDTRALARDTFGLSSSPVSSLTETSDQEMTCILIENINLMPSKTIASTLMNINSQSLEIVGLRLGHIPSGRLFTNISYLLLSSSLKFCNLGVQWCIHLDYGEFYIFERKVVEAISFNCKVVITRIR